MGKRKRSASLLEDIPEVKKHASLEEGKKNYFFQQVLIIFYVCNVGCSLFDSFLIDNERYS